MNQKEQILNILQRGESLTVLSALRRVGVYALSQRIGELIAEGRPIKSKWFKYTTDFGEKKQIKEYYMDKQEPPVWSMAQQELADNAWREHLQEASI